jgi:hypothetical protein
MFSTSANGGSNGSAAGHKVNYSHSATVLFITGFIAMTTTPKKMVQRFNRNILYGHVHDQQTYSSHGYNASDVLIGASLGCLCKIPQQYLRGAPTRWVQAITIFEFDTGTGGFWFNPIRLRDHKLVYNGEVFQWPGDINFPLKPAPRWLLHQTNVGVILITAPKWWQAHEAASGFFIAITALVKAALFGVRIAANGRLEYLIMAFVIISDNLTLVSKLLRLQELAAMDLEDDA